MHLSSTLTTLKKAITKIWTFVGLANSSCVQVTRNILTSQKHHSILIAVISILAINENTSQTNAFINCSAY